MSSSSSSSSSSLNRGLAVVQEATELDKAGQYAEASEQYKNALLLFAKATQEETNPKSVALIKQKMLEYRARRDEIKVLAKETTESSASTGARGTDDDDEDVPDEFNHPPAIDWGSLQEEEARRGGTSMAEVEAQRVKKQQRSELDKASALTDKATQLDAAKRFTEALAHYEAGLGHFLAAYQLAPSAPLKKAIKGRMELYMSRAEQLKKWLNSKKTEVSDAAAPHLAKAIDVVQQAIDLDNDGRHRAAIPVYESALEHFRAALQKETNANARNMITERMIKYSARIQQLEQTARSGDAVANPIRFGLAPGEKYVDPTKKKGFWK
jgi:tetratricopeptide (TPR) repeat protein